jgi:hypothetical protein
MTNKSGTSVLVTARLAVTGDEVYVVVWRHHSWSYVAARIAESFDGTHRYITVLFNGEHIDFSKRIKHYREIQTEVTVEVVFGETCGLRLF